MVNFTCVWNAKLSKSKQYNIQKYFVRPPRGILTNQVSAPGQWKEMFQTCALGRANHRAAPAQSVNSVSRRMTTKKIELQCHENRRVIWIILHSGGQIKLHLSRVIHKEYEEEKCRMWQITEAVKTEQNHRGNVRQVSRPYVYYQNGWPQICYFGYQISPKSIVCFPLT